MKNVPNHGAIFTRYDMGIKPVQKQARRFSEDEALQKVVDCLVSGDDESITKVVSEALEFKDPLEVINKGLIVGMKEVGRRWEKGSYFLPQVILSSDAMITGISVCEQKLGKTVSKKAKVVTHTAEGDIHDIGQVIVNALLRAEGFEVINLGADVPVDEVLEACKTHKPVMVTGTALMTTTMTAFPKIAARLKQNGLIIPFVCGGGAVSEEYVNSFELGIWGKDASQAPAMAEDALSGMGWEEMRAKWNG